MIDGVKITPLKQISDDRGKVMHMLRSDSPHFNSFGEIYFSTVYPGVVKAWHLHKKITLNYAVIYGEIKFVLYDGREGSNTYKEFNEFYISPENYSLITVPPNIWNGFKGVGVKTSIVANCATHPHDNNEIIRRNYNDPAINYDWNVKFK